MAVGVQSAGPRPRALARSSAREEPVRAAGPALNLRGAGSSALVRGRSMREAQAIANIVFSVCAALASLAVAVLSAVKGAPAVAVVFGLLFVGFLARAREGHRRGRRH
jgi:uncharacterized membrane protein